MPGCSLRDSTLLFHQALLGSYCPQCAVQALEVVRSTAGVYWWMRVEAVLRKTWLCCLRLRAQRKEEAFVSHGAGFKTCFYPRIQAFQKPAWFSILLSALVPCFTIHFSIAISSLSVKIISQRKGRSSQDLSEVVG